MDDSFYTWVEPPYTNHPHPELFYNTPTDYRNIQKTIKHNWPIGPPRSENNENLNTFWKQAQPLEPSHNN